MENNIPGIGKLVEIPVDVGKRLTKAQEDITAMAAAADKLEKSFSSMKGSLSSLSKELGGKNFKLMEVDEKGITRSLEIISDAVVKVNEKAATATKQLAKDSENAMEALRGNVKRTLGLAEDDLDQMKFKLSELGKLRTSLFGMESKKPGTATDELKQVRDAYNQLEVKIKNINTMSKGIAKLDEKVKVSPKTLKDIDKLTAELQKTVDLVEKAAAASGRRVPPIIEQARAKIDELNEATKQLAKDGEIENMSMKPFQKMFLGLESCERAAGRLGTVLRRTFSTVLISKFVSNVVKIRGEFQMAERSLAVILQDSAQAKEIFGEIQRIAVKSPFQVKDLVRQTKQLAAYRIENEKLVETTKMLGDISAGVGVDMNRLILAYGQVKAATFLKGTELRQFSEAGVNVLGALSKRFTELQGHIVTTGDVLAMVSKRLVSFEDVDAVLRQQSAAGGAFFRMQEKQAETIQGRISNIRDRLDITFNQIGKDYNNLINGVLDGLQGLADHAGALSTILTSGLLGGTAMAVIGTISKVTKALMATREAAGLATASFKTALAHIAKFGPKAVIAAAGLGILIAAWKAATRESRELRQIREETTKEFDEMRNTYERLTEVISDSSRKMSEREKALEELKTSLGNILPLQKANVDNLGKETEAYRSNLEILKQHNAELEREKTLRYLQEQQDKKNLPSKIAKGYGLRDSDTRNMLRKHFEPDYARYLKVVEKTIEQVRDDIRNGVVESTDDAIGELERRLSKYYNTSIKVSRTSENGYSSQFDYLTKQFGKFFEMLDDVDKQVAKTFSDIDITLTKEAEPIKRSIDELKKKYTDYFNSFGESAFTKEQLESLDVQKIIAENRQDPARLRLNAQNYARAQKIAIENSIKILETDEGIKQHLQDMVDNAWRSIDLSGVQKNFENTFMKLNDKFGKNLKTKFGTGVLAWKDDDTPSTYFKRVEEQANLARKALKRYNEEAAKRPILDNDYNKGYKFNPIADIEKEYGYKKEEAEAFMASYNSLEYRLLLQKYQEDNDKALKQSIRSFVSEVISAAKEMDKLDEKGKKLLTDKLNATGKSLGIQLPNLEKLNAEEWVKSLEKKLGKVNILDILLAVNKDETADRIAKIAQEVSTLWDKYTTAKKFEDFGVSLIGYTSADILNELKAKEDELRKAGTEDDIKRADEIKRRRLELVRSEQEEAGKLIYESQKKALSKVEQAYADMYEDIKKMAQDANDPSLDSEISYDDIIAGIKARTEKAAKEVAKAQWDAYKGTESYMMAFGDLEGLGEDVLLALKTELEAFKKNPLDPTEAKAVATALKNINEELASGSGKVKGYWDAFSSGMKKISEARDIMEELPTLQKAFTDAAADYQKALKKQDAAHSVTEDAYIRYQLALASLNDIEEPTQAMKDAVEELRLAWVAAAGDEATATTEAATALNNYNEAADNLNRKQKRMTGLLDGAGKSLNTMKDAYDKICDTIEGAISLVSDLGDAFGFTFGDVTQEAIDGFTQGLGIVASALSLATTVQAAYTAAVKAGTEATAAFEAVAWPLLVVAGALAIAVAAFKGYDAYWAKSVEQYKENVDELTKKYNNLTEAMNKALANREALDYYVSAEKNLKTQLDQLNEALAANAKRKQTDEVINETKALKEQIKDAKKELVGLKDEWADFMGSTSDWKGMQDSWAADWLSAFRKTGDGLSALEDDFDSFFDDMLVKQLSSSMSPYTNKLRKLVGEIIADGELTPDEVQRLAIAKQELAESVKGMQKVYDQLGGGLSYSVDTDTLQRGVQSVTEQTAQALESYLNSTRAGVWDNNALLRQLVAFSAEEGDNTIMGQMRMQTMYLRNLSEIASSVYYSGTHSKGAGGIKVFVD